MKTLTIKLDDDNKLDIRASEPMSSLTVIDMTLSACMAVMNTTLAKAPKEQEQDLKEHLFETFNIAASTLLAQFAPDIELRPDITEEAILNAELDIAHKYSKQ